MSCNYYLLYKNYELEKVVNYKSNTIMKKKICNNSLLLVV